MKLHYYAVPLSLCFMVLSGCDRKPQGQVVATVNGDEITRQQINELISNSGTVSPARRQELQNDALAQLVNRELLVQAAKARKIDKSPEYLTAVRQASDAIAIQMLQQDIVQSVHTPLDMDISQFIAQNPARFDQREILTVDQIRAPDAVLKTAWFAAAKSLDDVAAHLKQDGTQFERTTRQLDTTSLPPAILAKVKAAGSEPLGFSANGVATINVVVNRTPAPLIGDDAHEAALALMRRQSAEQALKHNVDILKSTAKVEYQPGFGPPKAPN
jgi:EpsD family peptidyl-prolyl cis-trans isomerase